MGNRLIKIAKIHQSANAPRLTKKAESEEIFEGIRFHVEQQIPLYSNIYRYGSDSFFENIRKARELWKKGSLEVCEEDLELMESDLGKFASYNGEIVPLDMPMVEELFISKEAKKKSKKKDPPLGKPKRGGSKKFYVYVRCDGKIKKISFGSPDMPLRISEDDRRRSFVARHKCKSKEAKNRCSAKYWSCRIGRYPHLTGAKKKYTWW